MQHTSHETACKRVQRDWTQALSNSLDATITTCGWLRTLSPTKKAGRLRAGILDTIRCNESAREGTDAKKQEPGRLRTRSLDTSSLHASSVGAQSLEARRLDASRLNAMRRDVVRVNASKMDAQRPDARGTKSTELDATTAETVTTAATAPAAS